MLHTHGTKRWSKAALAGVGLTLAISVVAMVARSPLSRSTPVEAASARAPITALVMLLAGTGIVALTALTVLAWPARRRRGDDEPELVPEPLQVHWIWKLVAIVSPFLLGGALVAAAVLGVRSGRNVPRIANGLPGRGSIPSHPSGAEGFVLPSWLPWTVLAIVLVTVSVGIVLRIVRRRERLVEESFERMAAHAAVEAAIGALGGAADPRAAVIAAYAAMERTLAAHGVARSNAEAPREYLRRTLAATSGTEREARTLTALFEEARFSTHPIPGRVRDRALSALSSLRARLQAGEAA